MKPTTSLKKAIKHACRAEQMLLGALASVHRYPEHTYLKGAMLLVEGAVEDLIITECQARVQHRASAPSRPSSPRSVVRH